MVWKVHLGLSNEASEPWRVSVQVRAVGKAPAYAAQVPTAAASLNSGDVFIVVAADKVYTWAGDSSTEEERTTAADVAEKLLAGATAREPVSIAEGEETEDFWAAIGGQGEHTLTPSILLAACLQLPAAHQTS